MKMKDERHFRELAAQARLETPPAVDVADRVMATLRAPADEKGPADFALAWVAAAAMVFAIPSAFLAATAWEALSDPLSGILFDLPWRML
jgi:hypothetical protein